MNEKKEISKIKIDNIIYEIKDEEVRRALFGDDYQQEEQKNDNQSGEKK